MDFDAEAREQKAFRRLTAAARALAKGTDAAPLAEEISNSYHNDPHVRLMRRVESIAAFLEGLVAAETGDTKESGTTARKSKTKRTAARTTARAADAEVTQAGPAASRTSTGSTPSTTSTTSTAGSAGSGSAGGAAT